MEPATWRVLDTGLGEPTWNMGLDEALLECFRPGDPPILRLYGWSPAAISLGRFQPHAELEVPSGAQVVRRLTGGSAIYHRSDELTYSVVSAYSRFGGCGPKAAYRAIHGVIERAVDALLGGAKARRGARTTPEGQAPLHGLCFDQATDYDLVVGGRKLVGSAQRRRGREFLQHGSLPFSPDPLTETSTSLSELLGGIPARETVVAALGDAFRQAGAELQPGEVRDDERHAAQRLAAERYATSDWTRQR